MVKTKRMNEENFASMNKDLTTVGELIRARQDEKQGLLNEFTAESKRFFFGKISEKSLASSVKKTNNELKRLDTGIKTAIAKIKNILERIRKLTSNQTPVSYKATLYGISGGQKKKNKVKKVKKKRKVKKKK